MPITRTFLKKICFFIGLFPLITGQTFGFSSGDKVYTVLTALSCLVMTIGILFDKYKKNEVDVCLTFILLSVAITFVTHRFTVLLSAVILICALHIPILQIFKTVLFSRLFSLVSLILLFAFKLIPSISVVHYSPLLGKDVTRISINGTATNIIHLDFFLITILLLVLYKGCRRLLPLLALFVLNLLLYFYITHSNTGVIMCTFTVIAVFIVNRMHIFEKILYVLSSWIVPSLCLFFIGTSLYYKSISWIPLLNKISTGRMAYNHYWVTNYGFSLFGNNVSGAEAAFDNSVIYVFIEYGIIFACILFSLYALIIKDYVNQKNIDMLIFVLLIFIYSMSESFLPSAVMNPSLFILLPFIIEYIERRHNFLPRYRAASPISSPTNLLSK